MNTKINGKYELELPPHRAAREQWVTGWEVERTEAMLDVLTPNDIMFEVGAEEADLTALFVKYSKCDVVLFEPNDRVLPCIKWIWQANKLKLPLDFFRGFLSDKTTVDDYRVEKKVFAGINVEEMISDHGFKQLYENYPYVPQITLDDYVEATGIIPTVLNIDVEGSEASVLRGAKQTLLKHRPKIFLSLHPEFLILHYNEWTTPLLRFIDECGYQRTCLEYDWHELHIMALPK